jgi:thiol-disulfide isomerase/thioredoxin
MRLHHLRPHSCRVGSGVEVRVQQDDPYHQQPTPAPIPQPRKSGTRFAAIIFLFAISFLYFKSSVFRNPKRLNMTSLDIKTLSGHPLNPMVFQGKAVVLNFWAPWCGPCQTETPWLQQLQAAHPNDLVVIGVDNDPDTYADAALFAASRGVTYPIVQLSGTMVNAIGAIDSIPTTFYIASSGKVVHTATGAISEARMESYASDALHH